MLKLQQDEIGGGDSEKRIQGVEQGRRKKDAKEELGVRNRIPNSNQKLNKLKKCRMICPYRLKCISFVPNTKEIK